MTAKEYLSQAYKLNGVIDSEIKEVERLKDLSSSISSPCYEQRASGSKNIDPPFVRYVGKIIELEQQINDEIDCYIDLKRQIHKTICSLKNIDERTVLIYRYEQGLSWKAIAEKTGKGKSTVKRIHQDALAHITMPSVPIIV